MVSAFCKNIGLQIYCDSPFEICSIGKRNYFTKTLPFLETAINSSRNFVISGLIWCELGLTNEKSHSKSQCHIFTENKPLVKTMTEACCTFNSLNSLERMQFSISTGKCYVVQYIISDWVSLLNLFSSKNDAKLACNNVSVGYLFYSNLRTRSSGK